MREPTEMELVVGADGVVGIREWMAQAGRRSSRAKTQVTTARKQMAGR